MLKSRVLFKKHPTSLTENVTTFFFFYEGRVSRESLVRVACLEGMRRAKRNMACE